MHTYHCPLTTGRYRFSTTAHGASLLLGTPVNTNRTLTTHPPSQIMEEPGQGTIILASTNAASQLGQWEALTSQTSPSVVLEMGEELLLQTYWLAPRDGGGRGSGTGGGGQGTGREVGGEYGVQVGVYVPGSSAWSRPIPGDMLRVPVHESHGVYWCVCWCVYWGVLC